MFDKTVFGGKRVLITGGTGGIGRAIAEAFAFHGAVVSITGLPHEVETWAEDAPFPAVALDVASQSQVDALCAAMDSLDVLVNCAGMIARDAEFEMETFLRVLDVNLAGTMRLCAGMRRLLAASRGSIVNIASMLSFFGGARVPAYSASKGGVVQLTKSLAIAWAPENIRVNAVAPGWIATGFTQALQEDEQRSAAILARTPMGRWGAGEDVAGAVLFLSSPLAAFVTGAVLPVDGGYAAM